MTDTPTTPEPDYPYPPRYWWTKRIALACISILLLLVFARLVWGWDANRRLRAEIDAIRALGEPASLRDIGLQQLSDSDNYVTYLAQAAASVNRALDPPTQALPDDPLYVAPSTAWRAAATTAIGGHQAALATLRAAKRHPQVAWKSTSIQAFYDLWNAEIYLWLLLGDKAIFDHSNGNDREAIDDLRDLLAMADAIERHPSLLGYIEAANIRDDAMERLLIVAADLSVLAETAERSSPSTTQSESLSRNEVKELIKWLINEDAPYKATSAVDAELASELENKALASNKSTLLKPLYVRSSARYVRAMNVVHQAASRPTRHEIVASLKTVDWSGERETGIGNMLSHWGMVSWTLHLDLRFRNQFERRTVAIALALRLYRLDHAGASPRNLAALVPDYLPEIPIDPFSPTSNQIRYILAEGGARPVVYSVGENAMDDTISEALLPPAPAYNWLSYPGGVPSDDQYRDLAGWRPKPAPPQSPQVGVSVSPGG